MVGAQASAHSLAASTATRLLCKSTDQRDWASSGCNARNGSRQPTSKQVANLSDSGAANNNDEERSLEIHVAVASEAWCKAG